MTNITIGSDPEFVIMCGDKIENALEIFTRVFPNIGCLPALKIAEYYGNFRYDYLEYALSNMELKYLNNKYSDIINKYSHLSITNTPYIIILNYYAKYGYPKWNEIPEKVKNMISDLIEEEYTENMEIAETGFCSTELGCDGQSALGEIRPKYGNNPIEHFDEILIQMEKLNNALASEIICYGSDQLQVKAGGYIEGEYQNYQLGGHIHIGFDELYGDDKDLYLRGLRIQKGIPNFLALYVGIPLTLIEKTKELTRHSSYGSFGAARNGEKYFGTEFRMPSSWLVSPQITIGALSLAYVVAYKYIKSKLSEEDTYRGIEYINKISKYADLYNKSLKYENFTPLKKHIPEIYSEIQKMELYPIYKVYIDYIFDMIEKNKIWESDTNILPRWAELW